jgi:transposase-like protein
VDEEKESVSFWISENQYPVATGGRIRSMKDSTVEKAWGQEGIESKTALEEVLRIGAQRMLMAAIEGEVGDYVNRFADELDAEGHRLVTRNGFLPERELVTGIGPVPVRQPRVNDRRVSVQFTSKILPPYMRRVPSIDALIPCLYLKGISTGDFSEALEAILGPQASGLSATNIVRLKEGWKQDYEGWRKRSLLGKHYVYIWVDGIHFNVRLDEDRMCILVIIGATPDGKKELLAVHDGYRESKETWRDILRDLKARGLRDLPTLATGDGALGFWAAAAEELPNTRSQRCWVHKTANILDKMPKSVQGRAKQRIHDMYMAETRKEALKAYEEFLTLYEAKYPRACECLRKDKEDLFTFYDFPAEHWVHLRTTNPIESTFATVRLRTKRTKGCGSRTATLTMVYKLAEQAERHWRRLNAHKLILTLIEGGKFEDGVLKKAA